MAAEDTPFVLLNNIDAQAIGKFKHVRLCLQEDMELDDAKKVKLYLHYPFQIDEIPGVCFYAPTMGEGFNPFCAGHHSRAIF